MSLLTWSISLRTTDSSNSKGEPGRFLADSVATLPLFAWGSKNIEKHNH